MASYSFYNIYEQLFGPRNCTYTVHVVCSHILQIRGDTPLTDTSAFKFENFYSELRRSFVPGTISPLKQIINKVLLKHSISSHKCQSDIYLSSHETQLETNNLIYTFQSGTYNIYQILRVKGNTLHCQTITYEDIQYPETPSLTWSKVGVFKKKRTIAKIVTINSNTVSRKVINVHGLLITCPINVLLEK